jgi:hypothetical protein
MRTILPLPICVCMEYTGQLHFLILNYRVQAINVCYNILSGDQPRLCSVRNQRFEG